MQQFLTTVGGHIGYAAGSDYEVKPRNIALKSVFSIRQIQNSHFLGFLKLKESILHITLE